MEKKAMLSLAVWLALAALARAEDAREEGVPEELREAPGAAAPAAPGSLLRQKPQPGRALTELPVGFQAPKISTSSTPSVRRAQQLMDRNKFPEAIKVLQLDAQVNPGSAEVLMNLGWACWHDNRYDEAHRAWKLLYALDPNNPLFVRLYASIELELGRPESAEKLAREALRLAPKEREASLVLAKALVALERIGEAKAVIDEQLERWPRHTGVLYQGGGIYGLMRRFDVAIGLYDRLVAIDPVEPRFGRRRAETLYELGRFEEALKQWMKLIDRDPPDGESLRSLGRAYFSVQAYDKAYAFWLRLAQRYPNDPAVLVLVAAVQIERGRLEEALDLTKKVLRLSPWDPDGVLLRAKALALSDRRKEARELLEAYIRRHPDQLTARFQVAELLSQMGLYEESLAQFDELLKRKPGHAPYRRLRAQVLFNMGKTGEAIAEWTELTRAQPPDVLSYLSLARGYAALGEVGKAVEASESFIGRRPDQADGYMILAAVHLDRGAADDAARAARRGLERLKGERDLTILLARAYSALGRYDEARGLLEALLPEHGRHPPLLFHLAEIELAEERYGAALPLLERLGALDPRNASYLRRRAFALYELGRADEAVAIWKRLADGEPPDPEALRRLAADAAVRRDWGEAVSWLRELAASSSMTVRDRSALAEAYLAAGRPKDALETTEEAIALDPVPWAPRSLRADALEALGRWPEAEAFHENAAAGQPNSERSALALARIAQSKGDVDLAAARLREARKRLGWPQLGLREARLLADAGKVKPAVRLAQEFAGLPEGGFTVLAYPGLAKHPRSEGIPVEALRRHLEALKRSGFKPLSLAEVRHAAETGGRLAANSVLLTFDDPRPNALEDADAVLRELGWKAVVFAHIGPKEPGRPSAAQLKKLAETGRWEIASHGVQAHETVPFDPAGHESRFLSTRRWLKAEKRLETSAEFELRVEKEYAEAREALSAAFPEAPAAFAYPSGDFGHYEDTNHPASAAVNRRAAAKSFDFTFAQDPWGFNVNPRKGAVLRRLEVQRDWTGESLASRLAINDPRLQARLFEGNLFLALGKPYKALKAYEKLEKEGLVAAELYAQKGVAMERVGYTYGAYKEYVKAYKLEPDNTRYRDLLLAAQMALGPHLAPTMEGFKDSDNRSHAKALLRMGTSVEAAQIRGWGGVGRFQENRISGIESRETGAGVFMPFNLWTAFELKYSRVSHRLLAPAMNAGGVVLQPGRLREADAYGAAFKATLTPSVRAEIGLDSEPVESAAAILNDRRVRRQRLGLDFDVGMHWVAYTSLEMRRYSEGNQERASRLSLMRRFDNQKLAMGYTFTNSASKFASPDYYSPRRLSQHMLALTHRPGKGDLRGLLQAAAGYGFQDSGTRFVNSFKAGLTWFLWKRIYWNAEAGYSRAPTYSGRWVNTSLTLGF